MISKKEQKQIIDFYVNERVSISKLGKIFHHKNYKIKEILVQNGITLRGPEMGKRSHILTIEEKEKIFELNQLHYSYKEISKEMGLSLAFIHDFLEKNNVKKSSYRKVDKQLNENVFEKIDTEEKAYFLGLLKTDGFIKNYKGQPRIGLSLKEEDKYMVEKLRDFFNSETKLYLDDRPNKRSWVFECSSQKIADDLSSYGIVPNETYSLKDIHIEKIPMDLQKHYLRGLVDGDGSIYIDSGYIRISFCGYSEDFVRSFQIAIDTFLNKTEHNKIFKANAFNCSWKGSSCQKILEYLYKDSTIFLARKKKFYDDINK